MSYYSRNVVFAAVLESAYATYAAPSAAANALLIGSNWNVSPDISKVERDVLRGFMGGKETIPGTGPVQITFSTELASSGAVGTAPAWGALLKAAGFAETITAGTQVAYTPISDAFPSLSFSAWFGGIRQNLKGCRIVKVDLDWSVGKIPTANWTLLGLEAQAAPVEAGLPAGLSLAAWKTPYVITDANSADLRFGTTLAAGTGILSGGTAYPSTGLQLSVSNSAKFRAMLGGESVHITQREITGQMTLDLPAADRVAFYTAYKSNGLTSLSFVTGYGTGQLTKLWLPAIERNDPANQDDDGLLLSSFSIRARPVAGNDELRLICM